MPNLYTPGTDSVLKMDKIKNPFSIRLSDNETDHLENLCSSEDVESILILPSFKLKESMVEFEKEKYRFVRYDDTVITARNFHPRYCKYLLGCGFAAFLIDIDYDRNLEGQLNKVFQNLLLYINQHIETLPHKIYRKIFPGSPSFQYKNRYSIPRQTWMDIVSGGIGKYLESIHDPHGLIEHVDIFSGRHKIDQENLFSLRKVLNPMWISGLSNKTNVHDNNILGLTGSHYLDLLFVDTVNDEALPSDIKLKNKLVLNIHSCGTRFWDILNPTAMRQLLDSSEVADPDLYPHLISLMENQATLDRISIALKFFEIFKETLGSNSLTPIAEQPHYSIKRIHHSKYKYYCDAQFITEHKPTIIPSGHPSGESYLIRAGKKSAELDHAVSHNFKMIISKDLKIRTNSRDVSIFRVCSRDARLFDKVLWRGPRLMSNCKTKQVVSDACRNYIADLERRGAIQYLAKLSPVMRLNVRRPGE